MISILNFGSGNIASISRLISKLGCESMVCSSPDEILLAKKIIIPGVGHFSHGMNSIKSKGLEGILNEKIIQERVPVLGICLGMQLFCQHSEEGGISGLGYIDASVKKFDFSNLDHLRIPHMGWNTIKTTRDNQLIPFSSGEQRFYFVHSYYVLPNDVDITIATSNYGDEFCAAFQKDNIFGVQFHPEKSHNFGIRLLKKFIDL